MADQRFVFVGIRNTRVNDGTHVPAVVPMRESSSAHSPESDVGVRLGCARATASAHLVRTRWMRKTLRPSPTVTNRDDARRRAFVYPPGSARIAWQPVAGASIMGGCLGAPC